MKKKLLFLSLFFCLTPFISFSQSNSCISPAPICGTNTEVDYPLTVETPAMIGNDYGCLDPWGNVGRAWHFVEVSQAGTINFTLTSDSSIGAAMWGPFDNLAQLQGSCGTLPAPFSCNMSSLGATSLSANATTPGQVFLILVMSYSPITEFSFRQTNLASPTSGAVDCSIVGNLNINCAHDLHMASCDDALPTPYPNALAYYNEGGDFGNACAGHIGLSDEILYDNEGSSCPNNARQVTRRYYIADVCGNIGICQQNIFFPESDQAPVALCPPSIGISCFDDIDVSQHLSSIEVLTDCGLGYTLSVIDSSYQGGWWGQECDFADYIYQVRVTDACGRSSDCELRYTLLGNAPVFEDDTHPHPDTCILPPLIKECNDPFLDHEQLIEDWINGMTVTGSCGQDITVTTNYSKDNFVYDCGLAGSQVVTFRAEDECGRESFCTGTIINIDTKPPNFSSHAENLTVNCSENVDSLFNAWLEDYGGLYGFDCCTEVIWSYEPENPSVPSPCSGNNSIDITFVATDECGLAKSEVATFTVEGDAELMMTVEANDMNIDCNNANTEFQTWLDNHGGAVAAACGAITWTTDPVSPLLVGICGEAVEVTFIASDACGDSVSTTASFTATDTTSPTLPTPAALGEVLTATDNCDTDVPVTYTETNSSNGCEVTGTWIATDDCGNSNSVSFTETVIGTGTPPEFASVPADMTIDCTENPVFGTPTLVDDTNVTITIVDNPIDGACEGTTITTRTWTATNECGTTATATQTINSEDITPPAFTSLPIDLTFFCDETIDFPMPTTTDDCGSVSITFTDELNEGATTENCNNGFGYDIYRTWTATDACGNATTAETVAWVVPEGYTGPVFNFVPQNRTLGCEETPVFGEAQCTSACGDVIMTHSDSESIGDCNSTTIYVRTWSGVDACGNVTTASQTLTVPMDTEAPVFTFIPENKNISCGENLAFGTPECTDNCGAIDHLNIQFEDIELTEVCAIERRWTVSDACGNVSHATQRIIMNDTEAPVVESIWVEKTIACGQVFEFETPTASDACSTVDWSFIDDNQTMDCAFGEIRTRIWTATDRCGNASSITQTIRIEDNEAPVFDALPAPQEILCGATFEFAIPSVNDACSEVTLTHKDELDDDYCENGNRFRRVWTATDACGNMAQAEQIFTSPVDNTAPTFSATPQDRIISCTDAMQFDNIAATDVCSGVELVFIDEPVEENCANGYSMRRTWTATDNCGNMNQITQTITMEDNEAPVFSIIPQNKVIGCGELAEFDDVVATDMCSDVTLDPNDETIVGACENTYTLRRTWTAIDACGNINEISQDIIVEDNTAPAFDESITDLEMTASEYANWTLPTNLATDDCSVVTEEFQSNFDCLTDMFTYNITATDACGNINQKDLKIQITDAQPIIEINAPQEIECGVAYPISANISGGLGAYDLVWSIESDNHDWTLQSEDGELQFVGGEGTANLRLTWTNEYGCTSEATITVSCAITINTTDVETLMDFSLAPNPTAHQVQLTLQATTADVAQLEVYDLLGQRLLQQQFAYQQGTTQHTLDVSNWTEGTYIVFLTSDKVQLSQKLIKY